MLISYIGPSTAGVDIAATGQHAPKGEPVDVPDEVATSLLEQDIWQAVKAEKEGK